jgi:orotidine-5'-phosphate decarboxylase
MDQLPAPFRSGADRGAVAKAATAVGAFCCAVIDVVAPLVPAVKPQAAFFEQLGPPGMSALAGVIQYARSKGLIVILDAKRNDIGSTAMAYAEAYLGQDSAWGADALTVNPYLGEDSLQPFVDRAIARLAGIFVLVKTSNPGGGQFQDLVADQVPLYRPVARHVDRLAAEHTGPCGYSSIGAVVGATYPQQLGELRRAMPRSWLLVPGFGSQGGTARDVAGAMDEQGLGAVVNNSRGILFAHQQPAYRERFSENRWQEAVEAATLEMVAQLRAETTAGRLAESAGERGA